jgi:hypothetical protein
VTTYLAVTENRQYYSLLTTADLQQCKKGLFKICEATFPFIHKTRATCASALYFGQIEFVHKMCRKVILVENFNPVWLQDKGPLPFWIYSPPSSIIVTKRSKVNGTTSSSIELTNTGILDEDTNCQFYSEDFVTGIRRIHQCLTHQQSGATSTPAGADHTRGAQPDHVRAANTKGTCFHGDHRTTEFACKSTTIC